MSDNPRPFLAQARRLCPETDEHHDRVWFCMTCRMFEQRLTPITVLLADLLFDASLIIRNPFAEQITEPTSPYTLSTLTVCTDHRGRRHYR